MEAYEMAKQHFEALRSSIEGQKELSKYEGVMQFELRDEASFYIEVTGDRLQVGKGKYQGETKNMITFTTDRYTVRDIFYKGQLSPGLADFVLDRRVWIRGAKSGSYTGDDKPITAWAAKLLRMHV